MAGAGRLAVLALALTVQAALAEAPVTSLRPQPRGGTDAAVAADPVTTAGVIRPRPRPAAPSAIVAPADSGSAVTDAPQPAAGLASSLRPMPRPQNLAALLAVPQQAVAPAPPQAAPAPAPALAPEARPRRGLLASLFGPPRTRPDRQPDRQPDAPRGTYVCGDRAIIGRELDPIGNPDGGCGVAEPVQVSAVDGVTLSQAATMDCPTALALHRWIDEGLRPAFRGREPAQLTVAAHYICRTRNNRPGARISEHGRGKAIDIAGIVFADGSRVTVSDDYGRALRKAHRAACGIFGTTLGPGSDGYHEDHLHFDTAQHRNGPYCR
jgi:hypothetical protein